MRIDCVINELGIRIVRCLGPDGESESAARLQNTTRLSAGSAWVGQMEQGEICHNPVKALVSKREGLRVAFAKFNARKHVLRDQDHLVGEIQSRRYRPALLYGPSYIAGP